MDVESPSVQIRNFMTRVPPGVVDIDAINDPLKCTQYAQEICDYLQVLNDDSDDDICLDISTISWKLEVIKLLSCSTQLSMKCILLLNAIFCWHLYIYAGVTVSSLKNFKENLSKVLNTFENIMENGVFAHSIIFLNP